MPKPSLRIEVDKEEADEILAETRHSDIKEMFRKLSDAISKKKEGITDNALLESISDLKKIINELAKAILSQPKPEKPQVNVEVNQDKIVTSISKLEECVDKILEGQQEILNELKLLNRPKGWKFDIKRNQYTNNIESVTANMDYSKLKYQA